MKKKILFTLVMTVSLLCVGVQAQEFRYGLSGGVFLGFSSAQDSLDMQ